VDCRDTSDGALMHGAGRRTAMTSIQQLVYASSSLVEGSSFSAETALVTFQPDFSLTSARAARAMYGQVQLPFHLQCSALEHPIWIARLALQTLLSTPSVALSVSQGRVSPSCRAATARRMVPYTWPRP
jgi:hypothetical protein